MARVGSPLLCPSEWNAVKAWTLRARRPHIVLLFELPPRYVRPAAARSASTLAASVGASLSRASGATAISGNRKVRTACLWMLDARLKRLNTLFIFEIRWVLSILKIAFRAVACVEQARDVTGRVLAHCRTQPRASQSDKSSSQRPRASKAATANVVWRLFYVCAWAYPLKKSSAFV